MLYYATNRLLLIVIVTVCSKNIHIDLRFKDTVNKPMPIGYPSAPPTFRLPFERFWMPGTGLWVYLQFSQKTIYFIECFRIILC